MDETDQSRLTNQGKPRTAGFRLSPVDVVVLAIAIVATAAGAPYIGEHILLIPFVVGHFFLFCNVFRVRRKPELFWAGIFLFNCGAMLVMLHRPLIEVFVVQLSVSIIIIQMELRHPTYHGVLAHRLNPHLDQYLKGEV
jgi:hypothetical protein